MKSHPFRWGRRLGIVVAIGAATCAFAYRYWYSDVDIGDYGMATMELALVVAALTSWIALSPAMATWEALAQSTVRKTAARWSAGCLLIYASLPVTVWALVRVLPQRLIPQSHQFDMSDVPFDQFAMVASNVAIVTAVGLIAVTYLGRLAGASLTLVTYGGLFVFGALSGSTVPYGALPTDHASPAQWLVAVIAVGGAVYTAFATGGTTTLARHIDPRSLT